LKELLEALRIQRHDFANHLQVISGFVQLKKYDQAMQYIARVGEDLNRAGSVARIGSAEIAATIFVAEHKANKVDVSVNTFVETDLALDLKSEYAVSEIIKDMLGFAVNQTNASSCVHGDVDLDISKRPDEYVFIVSFCCNDNTDNLALESGLVFLKEAATKAGGRLESRFGANNVVVMTLTVPTGGQ
jgi:sensor histidine kinase regulating citrate/malate metabolism